MTVLAHHLVWTNYGTWLGNDPRGSGSNEVYTPRLALLGNVHRGRRKVQPRRSDVKCFYEIAEPELAFPVIRFNAAQIHDVAEAFADVIRKYSYTCYACAIMPDHVHLVIRKHQHQGEEMLENFQRHSRIAPGLVDQAMMEHPIWTKGGWDRYLDSPAAIRSRIRYVEGNPEKDGLTRQAWPFVVPYDNWPFHKAKLNRKALN